MGLKAPSRPATVEGSPKTPLPITEFTTNAVRLQRPMARTNCWLWETWGSVSGTGCFYHKWALRMTTVAAGRELGQPRRLSTHDCYR